MNKKELVEYLDSYLNIKNFNDSSKNGLQVDSQNEEIQTIGYAVDATTYIFDKAKEENVDFLITHHGIFWGHEQTLTAVPYTRAKKLIDANIALYGSHLPLDAHPEVGNNIGLVKAFINIFGLQEGDYEIESFASYNGVNIGFGIKFKKQIHISNLITPYCEQMQLVKEMYNFGNKQYINSIGFVRGGALSELDASLAQGYDAFVTGEGSHGKIISAKEKGATILLGGHYETEKIGVKLLAHHLKNKFGLDTVFLDEKY